MPVASCSDIRRGCRGRARSGSRCVDTLQPGSSGRLGRLRRLLPPPRPQRPRIVASTGTSPERERPGRCPRVAARPSASLDMTLTPALTPAVAGSGVANARGESVEAGATGARGSEGSAGEERLGAVAEWLAVVIPDGSERLFDVVVVHDERLVHLLWAPLGRAGFGAGDEDGIEHVERSEGRTGVGLRLARIGPRRETGVSIRVGPVLMCVVAGVVCRGPAGVGIEGGEAGKADGLLLGGFDGAKGREFVVVVVTGASVALVGEGEVGAAGVGAGTAHEVGRWLGGCECCGRSSSGRGGGSGQRAA
ncbi:hypothetical protein L1887_51945 [Cichorium endivia]|nr:hypothetical protein L1887_51945 [Cichorium endivia]